MPITNKQPKTLLYNCPLDGEAYTLANQPFTLQQKGHRLTVRLVRQDSHRLLFFEEESPAPPVEELRYYGLTTREREVTGWVIRGKTNGDIASILGISPETVHRHLSSVYRKLTIENRAALVTMTQHLLISKKFVYS